MDCAGGAVGFRGTPVEKHRFKKYHSWRLFASMKESEAF